jgi:RNA polymerase sigma factor (sigma-70 family)
LDTSIKIEFIKLYEPVHDQLSKYCRAISGNPEDGEDLLQDTILNSFEGFSRIKDKNAFKTYLFSVASNLHKMRLRRLKFKFAFNDKEINQIIDLSQDPEYLTDFKIIYDKMLSLPERMAEALILFHMSDLSLEEIQKIQGGSLSGVKLRLKRGRAKLLSLLNTKEHVMSALMFFTL